MKYPENCNLREKGFTWTHNSNAWSILEVKSRWQEFNKLVRSCHNQEAENDSCLGLLIQSGMPAKKQGLPRGRGSLHMNESTQAHLEAMPLSWTSALTIRRCKDQIRVTRISSSLSFPLVREDFPSGELDVTDYVCTSQSNPIPVVFSLVIWGQVSLLLYCSTNFLLLFNKSIALQNPLSVFFFLRLFLATETKSFSWQVWKVKSYICFPLVHFFSLFWWCWRLASSML